MNADDDLVLARPLRRRLMPPPIALAGLLIVWACLVLETIWIDAPRRTSRRDLVAAGLFVLAFVVRFTLMPPTFAHANLHGTALLEAIYAFPGPPTHRSEYGPVGFAVLGAFTELFGEDFAVVRAVNCGFSAVFVVAIGAFVRNLSGDARAGFFAAAFALISQPLAWLANSEDVQNVGLAFFGVGLYALEVHLVTRERPALALALLSLLGMLYTRQTFFVLLPAPLLLVLAHRFSNKSERLDPLCAAFCVLLLLASGLRLGHSLGHPGDATTYARVVLFSEVDGLLPRILARHPLLDIERFGAVATGLIALGLAAAARSTWPVRALALSFLIAFSATLPFAFANPSVELLFRTPAIALAAPLAGLGATALLSALRASWASGHAGRLIEIALVVLVTSSAFTSPARAWLMRPSAEYAEYLFLKNHLVELPPGATLWVLGAAPSMPPYDPSPHVRLVRPDLRIEYVDVERAPLDADANTYFLAGLQCFGYGAAELEQLDIGPSEASVRRNLERFARGLFEGRWNETTLVRTASIRPICASLLRRSDPHGEHVLVEDVQDDAPFVFYGQPSFTLTFRKLRPAVPETR